MKIKTMAHQSFAKSVCDTVRQVSIANGEATAHEVSCLLGLPTRKEHKRLLNTMSELSRRGKIVRVRQGVYAPAPVTGDPNKQEVMWRLLRMRRTVTIADLEEMAGVSPSYAREWLGLLVKRSIAVVDVPVNPNNPISWRLIKSDVEMPVDEEKSARLRELRKRKKANLCQMSELLDAAGINLDKMRTLLQNMEDGDE